MAYQSAIKVGDSVGFGLRGKGVSVVTVISSSTIIPQNYDIITTAAFTVTVPSGSITRSAIGNNGVSTWVIGQL